MSGESASSAYSVTIKLPLDTTISILVGVYCFSFLLLLLVSLQHDSAEKALTCVVIIELDVPVFVSSDADRERGMADDSVYLAGRIGC